MHHNEFELVSIVIPTHNRQPLLERAINSARAQSWPNIEIIVVDDASSDSTDSYLQREAKIDTRVRFIRNDVSKGGAGARNAGIKLALGTFVAFLDDDDLWAPEKLTKQINLLKSNPSASSVSCSFMVEHSSGKRTLQPLYAPDELQQVLKANKFGGASMCLTTKAALEKIGGFDPSLRSGQDWELWIKLCIDGPLLMCPEPLVRYQIHDGLRISTNQKSVYFGRRSIYFKYKKILSESNRIHHLRDLVYLRLISRHVSRLDLTLGLIRIFKMYGIKYGVKCIFRLIRRSSAS